MTNTEPHKAAKMSSGRSAAKRRHKTSIRLLLWRWHRRVGLLVALVVLLLSVTGILLNHVSGIPWLHQPVQSGWLLSAYGIKAPKPVSYRLGNRYITTMGGDYFYLDEHESAYCRGRLKGAALDGELIVVACGDELVLLNSLGEVVERIGAAYGLPSPVEELGHCGEQLCLISEGQVYALNIDQLNWQLLGAGSGLALAMSEPQALPKAYEETLIRDYLDGSITWERVVLDLHNGRLFGIGAWLMDIVAAFLILLAFSGVSMWYGGKRRRHR